MRRTWEKADSMINENELSESICARADIGNECVCEECINEIAANVAAMGADEFEQ